MSREYTSPYQVLCEGDGDTGFVNALAQQYNVPAFETTCVASDGGFLTALRALEVFVDRDIIRRILILADNDSNPHAAFQRIQRDVDRAGIYPIPKAPLHIRGGPVQVAVVMVPATDQDGNLETLLLKNARVTDLRLVQCSEAFATCALNGAEDGWSRGHRDKMLLRSVLAARIEDDPNCSLNYLWGKSTNPMNIGSSEFKWVADFMLKFFQV